MKIFLETEIGFTAEPQRTLSKRGEAPLRFLGVLCGSAVNLLSRPRIAEFHIKRIIQSLREFLQTQEGDLEDIGDIEGVYKVLAS